MSEDYRKYFLDTYLKPLIARIEQEQVSHPDCYVSFLENDIEAINEILGRLILAHGEHKPIDSIIEEIEKWMGDDWYVDLSIEDQDRLDAIKGWTYE